MSNLTEEQISKLTLDGVEKVVSEDGDCQGCIFKGVDDCLTGHRDEFDCNGKNVYYIFKLKKQS